MPRTQKQLEAYCEDAVRNGIPAGEIISILLSEEMDEDTAREMFIRSRKVARKPALIMIVAGITLSTIGIGSTIWACSGSGGYLFIWYGPAIAGIVVFCAGVTKLIQTTA